MTNAFDAFDEGGSSFFQWGSQANAWKIDGTEAQLKKFLIDPASVKTGFGKITAGETPIYVWSDVPGTTATSPGVDYKPAFFIDVFVTEADGAPSDGWRPWSTNARASRDAVKAIWNEIHDGAAKNPGKVAVIKADGSEPKKFGPATVRVPKLSLAGFVDRPDAGNEAPAPAADDGEDLF